MLQIIGNIITNVLKAFYQPFWASILYVALFMFLYLYAKEHHGFKQSVRIWLRNFQTDSTFRRMCFLVFYTVMILFRTILDRHIWANPLSDVMGGWTLVNEQGAITTEPLENILLFIPFTVLLLWTFEGTAQRKECFVQIVKQTTKIAFLFAISIESMQLIFRIGTIQLSDIFYNTLGGLLGGIGYWSGCKAKKFRRKKF